MAVKYLINNRVIFDPETRSLTVTPQTPGVISKLTLHTPTSHCLALLIERRDEVISQDELLELIWKPKGVIVSSNTVYQNISLLRRSFNQLGINKEVIITVPRKGITLSKSISIIPFTESDELDSQGEPFAMPLDSDAMPIAVGMPSSIEPPPDKRGAPYYYYSGIVIVLLAILCIVSLLTKKEASTNYMDSYDLVATPLKGCKVFVNDNVPQEKLRKILNKDEIDCSSHPFNYVTAFDSVSRYSVIRCVKDISSARPGCLSEFYLEASQ